MRTATFLSYVAAMNEVIKERHPDGSVSSPDLGPAMHALDMAHECDRLREAVVSDAEHQARAWKSLAEKAARGEALYGSSPLDSSSALGAAKNAGALELAEKGFFTAFRLAFGPTAARDLKERIATHVVKALDASKAVPS